MKRFRAFVGESYFDSIRGEGKKVVDIYKNPDRRELRGSTSRYNDSRGIVRGSDIHVWNGDEALHHHVRGQLGISDGIDVSIDHGKKEIQLWGDPDATKEKFRDYQDSSHFNKHFKDYKILT